MKQNELGEIKLGENQARNATQDVCGALFHGADGRVWQVTPVSTPVHLMTTRVSINWYLAEQRHMERIHQPTHRHTDSPAHTTSR